MLKQKTFDPEQGLRLKRSLHWGPFPFENTGGHVVQEYLLDKMHDMSPNHKFFGIPKNVERLDPKQMKYIKFFTPKEGKGFYKLVPELMSKFRIPLLVAFHIAHQIEPAIDAVHDVGAKILMHQTVHFRTDALFSCSRLNAVDYYVAPTEWAKYILNKQGKVSKRKITVIPHGVDTKKFYPHETPTRKYYRKKRKIVILFSGRLSVWKGIHQIIPLFREFTKKYNCVFLIRGQPIEIHESMALDAVLKIISKQNENVVYLSTWQDPSVVEDLYASADIMVSPTGSEGFNVPLIEAMACKMPVITTSLPNHVEILGPRAGTAIFVKPKVVVGWADERTKLRVPTVNDLREALKYLVENPEERQIMGEIGRERVLQHYDLEKVVSQWFKVMDKLIPEDYSMEKRIMKRMGRR